MVLVANRQAGRFRGDLLRQIISCLTPHGSVDVVETDRPSQLTEIIAALGPRQLLVAGGDGTIRHTVDQLRRAGQARTRSVGVIPIGSGNDLLTGLGCTTDPVAVASAWHESTVRSLDLVTVNDGDTVVNAAGMGIGLRAAGLSGPLKAHVPGWLAYGMGAAAAAAITRGWRLQVRADGRAIAPARGHRALSVVVANGSTFGGGAPAVPDAEPNDGALDVLVSHASGPLARIGYGIALRRGDHIDRTDVAHIRCQDVTVVGEPVGCNLDGDLERARRTRRSFRVVPHAWKLRMPWKRSDGPYDGSA